MQNAWIAQPQINGSFTTRAWLNPDNPLFSADGTAPVAPKQPPYAAKLTGSLGTHARPRLLSVHGGDPDNADDIFSNGDTITFTFNMGTYIGQQGSRLTADRFRPDVDADQGEVYDATAIHALFEFNYYLPAESEKRVPSFGRDYSGKWVDDSTFVMTILDSTRRVGFDDNSRVWNRMPRINEESYTGAEFGYTQADSIWVQVLGDVRSVGRQSERCTDRVPLSGDWGERSQRPKILSFVSMDPDNSDNMPSPGDTLTIVFDRRTSKGRTARPPPPEPGTKAYADFYLRFDPIIASDYTAVWRDDSTFVLTVLAVDPDADVWVPDPGTMRVLPTSQIRNFAATSDPADWTLQLNMQTFGLPGSPVMLSAIVSDYDNFVLVPQRIERSCCARPWLPVPFLVRRHLGYGSPN